MLLRQYLYAKRCTNFYNLHTTLGVFLKIFDSCYLIFHF